MNWIQIKLKIKPEQATRAEIFLNEYGALAVTFLDAADEPLYEIQPKTTPLWQNTQLIALFDDYDIAITVKQALAKYFVDIKAVIDILPDQNWQQALKEDFKPVKFANKLWVYPSWKKPAPDDGLLSMCLDPGIAFGTGAHPTTALCLEWLASATALGDTVIDYGCGSGILSIATTILGAKQVIAVDIDQQALEATRNNANTNNITADKLITCLPDKLPKMQADILIANIFASTLIKLQDTIKQLLKPGGTLLLSGILTEDTTWVMSEFAMNFNFEAPKIKDGWVLLVAKHKN